jgi:hypothetical protein
MFSGKPAASIVVTELIDQRHMDKPQGRRRLNPAGMAAADFIAETIADLVDEALEKRWNRRSGNFVEVDPAMELGVLSQEPVIATCSCGSGIPVGEVMVEGHLVTLIALPLIFEQLRLADRRSMSGLARELLEMVKIYNPIPPGADEVYGEALLREFTAYCSEKEPAR